MLKPTWPERTWQVRVSRANQHEDGDFREGPTQGGGVWIGERWILTCAHVIGAVPRHVYASFTFVGGPPILAHVVPDGWVPKKDGDLALLELEDDPPPGARPAPTCLGRSAIGHSCDAYGYPKTDKGMEEGVLSDPRVNGPALDGWLQLTAQVAHGQPIQKGFSGTGLVDTITGAVIGLVVAIDRNPRVKGGFAIPLYQAKDAFPQIAPWLGWRLSTDEHLHTHWLPRARGVHRTTDTDRGWYFTGRKALVNSIIAWLNDSSSDRRIRVVTGPAGTGKSAVLAWLCALSDPNLRKQIQEAAPEALADPRTSSIVGRISAAVWARDGDLRSIIRSLSTALDVPVPPNAGPADFLAVLNTYYDKQLTSLTIVIDALDEATEAIRIARDLLIPLRDSGVKVLVGTRPGHENRLLLSLGRNAERYDLEDPDWYSSQDLIDYTTACLRADLDPARPSNYRDNPEACATVAAAIAESAAGNFLVAGLAARTRSTEKVIDIDQPGWEKTQDFPEQVGEAFDDYLRRLGNSDEAQKAEDLLRALAYVQGPGLRADDPLWAVLATAVAVTRTLTVQDIDWLLRTAADYLVRADNTDDGPRYRLFHQALIDYLAPDDKIRHNHRRITDSLLRIASTTHRNSDGSIDWGLTPPYLRTYLATHAAAGGRLDDLILDPQYLLVAEPASLLRALHAAHSPQARLAAEAFRMTAHRRDERPAALRLAALQIGAGELAKRIRPAEPPSGVRLWPAWTWWRRPTPSTTVAELESTERSVVTVTDSMEHSWAVTTEGDGVTSWDLAAGTHLAHRPMEGAVKHMAMVRFHEQDALLCTVGNDLELLSLPDLERLRARSTGHPGDITTITTLCTGHTVATGDDTGVIKTWFLPDLMLGEEQHNAHTLVFSLTEAPLHGGSLLLSGGDFYPRSPGLPRITPTLRGWSLPGLEEQHWTESPGRSVVNFVRCCAMGEMHLVVVCELTRTGVWKLDGDGKNINRTDFSVDGATIHIASVQNKILLFGYGYVQPITVLSNERIESAHPVETTDEALAWAGPTTIDGRKVMVSAGNSLRMWDLDDLSSGLESTPLEHLADQQRRQSITNIVHAHSQLFVTTGDNRVLNLDRANALPMQNIMSHDVATEALAAYESEGMAHIVIGDMAGGLLCVDTLTGHIEWNTSAGTEVEALATVTLNDRPVVAAAVKVSRDLHVCRLWDILTGREISTVHHEEVMSAIGMGGPEDALWNFHMGSYSDKYFTSIAATQLGDSALLAAAGYAPHVRVWNLSNQSLMAHLPIDRDIVSSLALEGEYLVAGNSAGRLYLWNLKSGEDAHIIPQAHDAGVTGLALGRVKEREFIFTGGYDRKIKMWNMSGGLIDSFDIGEKVWSLDFLGSDQLAVGTIRGLLVINFA